MIQLTRPPKPPELTAKFQKDQTDEFKRSEKIVWNHTFIRSALRTMSNSKCAFCECQLEEESKYLEVEHFAPKDTYPDRVLEWTNLLPACRRCNARKRTHDTIVVPIVDPVPDDPRDYLRLRLYRFEGRDQKGSDTVDVLELNEFKRLMLVRFRIGEAVLQQLDEVVEKIQKFCSGPSDARARNRILRQMRNLLHEAQPDSEYSATVATAVAHSEQYAFATAQLKALGFWSAEFVTMDAALQSIAYPR